MKTVHLIFKTHLDIGFTNFSRTVVSSYFERYIPSALSLACEMRESGKPERFIWTTGSWLIYEYLEQAGTKERKIMEQGIMAGDIAWHGLPFTTHSELMDVSLFRFGLSLSQQLDRRFGRKTIAAKMTDVPGHTRGIVPLMAEAGLKFLHIGVNPVCPAPIVPPVFLWKSPEGSELIVAYSADYGRPISVRGLEDVLVFAHTGDNAGPQSSEKIRQAYQEYRRNDPGARVMASTMDAFAAKLLPLKSKLPVVTKEIGDTWIHGGATDPLKVARYRALSRLRSQWEADGRAKKYSRAFYNFSRSLLLIPEHTWGMDEKTHLGDYVHYSNPDFQAALKSDLVPESAVPGRFQEFGQFRKNAPEPRRFSTFAASWQEQRDYITQALGMLKAAPLAREAAQTLAELKHRKNKIPSGSKLDASIPFTAGRFTVQFDARSGALTRLQLGAAGPSWCEKSHSLGLYRYQTFSQGSYDRWLREYPHDLEKYRSWAIPDFTKPGMDKAKPQPQEAFWKPQSAEFSFKKGHKSDTVFVSLKMPAKAQCDYGAPQKVYLIYEFPYGESFFRMDLCWLEKRATRLPEASWLSFSLAVNRPERWRMDKLGQIISPLEVVSHGNRNMHGIGTGAFYNGPEGSLAIESLDAPLVAPGTPRLLRFDDSQPALAGGMHFNLHSNVWGSNFPMWYDDDARFRFIVRLGNSPA